MLGDRRWRVGPDRVGPGRGHNPVLRRALGRGNLQVGFSARLWTLTPRGTKEPANLAKTGYQPYLEGPGRGFAPRLQAFDAQARQPSRPRDAGGRPCARNPEGGFARG